MFDPNAYQLDDQPAKRTASGWLTQRGHTVQESGRYAIDLSVTTSGVAVLDFECERRHIPAWSPGRPFPYPAIHIPERKAKFAYPGSWFAITNESCTSLVFIPGPLVTGSPLLAVSTSRGTEEAFFDVSVSGLRQARIAPAT